MNGFITARNQEILTRYFELQSHILVAREFGVSKQRVHQIVRKYYLLNNITPLKKITRYTDKPCLGCQRIFDGTLRPGGGGYCNRCRIMIRKGRTDFTLRWHRKPDNCVLCGNDWSLSPHQARGRCRSCWQKEKLKDPVERKKHYLRTLDWARRNIEKVRASSRKSSRKYYLKKRKERYLNV